MSASRPRLAGLLCALACGGVLGCDQAPVVVARIAPLDGGGAGSGGPGDAGPQDAATGGADERDAGVCALEPRSYYDDLAFLDRNDCLVPESYRALLDRLLQILMSIPAPPAAVETRGPDTCEVGDIQIFYRDLVDPTQWRVCENECNAAKQRYYDALDMQQMCLEQHGVSP